MEDAREDVRATREQISETAGELSDRIHEVERKLNPLEYVREYPWAALAIATGIGVAISVTRADRKAAKAGMRGAKAAGSAVASGAAKLKDQAVDLVQHHDEAESGDAASQNANAAAEPSVGSRIRDRFQSSVHGLLSHGLDELLREIRR